MRIVTLLPSATEIVCGLGYESDLVGVSHSCNFPPSVAALPKMTSTRVPYKASSNVIDTFVREHLESSSALYDLNLDALRTAAPDVIVSQALCDVCAVSTGDVAAALHSLPSKPVLIDLNPNTLDDVLDDCLRVGVALGDQPAGRHLVEALRQRLGATERRSRSIAQADRPGVAFLEWLDPPFNGGHWNPQLVALAGGVDLLGTPGQPSSTLDWAQVSACQPEVLFIACCGYDTARALQDVVDISQRTDWQALPAVRNGRVYFADGDAYFARPGPRLIDGLEMMAHALHPDIHPQSTCGTCHRLGT